MPLPSKCYKRKLIRTYQSSEFRQIEGKTLIVWPPDDCLRGEQADRVAQFARMRNQYGLCVLNIGLGRNYEDAILAGWDNDSLQLRLGSEWLKSIAGGKYWKLYTEGQINYRQAVESAFTEWLAFADSKWRSPNSTTPTPAFYSIYVDEPQRGLYAFQSSEGKEITWSLSELEALYDFIKTARESGNKFFSQSDDSGKRRTQFYVSAFEYDNPIGAWKFVEWLAPLCDAIFYSGYDKPLVRGVWDWVFHGQETHSDQSRQWQRLAEYGRPASGWISLESDYPDEFGVLMKQAAALKWDTIGIFGGSGVSCEEFFTRLDRFCTDAARTGWMREIKHYTDRYESWYCSRYPCDCDPGSDEGWLPFPSDLMAVEGTNGRIPGVGNTMNEVVSGIRDIFIRTGIDIQD